ncbi:30S ribosomal protein S1 [Symbiodinium microadriaticum]|uniref:30S ribosomal protein S1 n=1 Tax=Symbiodinium microadriaticum TaxID=2951 RepID=A0A1Q9F5V2_SYMMI|nr:30S ribosomal protein S1 [Symbiodinium microadriaticum]
MKSRRAGASAVGVAILLVASTWSQAFITSPGHFWTQCPRHRADHPTCRGAQEAALAEKQLMPGDAVRVLHPERQEWCEGVIQAVKAEGLYSVKADMPDRDSEWLTVEEDELEPMFVYKDFRKGNRVLFVLQGVGATRARVKDVQPRGMYVVTYRRPGGPAVETIVHAKDMRLQTSDLRPSQKCTGKIHAIDEESEFAIIDMGTEAYGKLSLREVPEDLYIGQEVEVKIVRIHLKDQSIQVAWAGERRRPARKGGAVDRRPIRMKMRFNAFADIPTTKWLDGKVMALLEYGAMVRVWLDPEKFADGLVHKTSFRDGPVEDVASELRVGQAVQVRVKRLDLVKQQLEFTMYNYVPTTKSALSVFAAMPQDRWLKGKVRKLMPFGLFVTVQADDVQADGLVHVRNAKEGFLPKLEDEFYVGQEVDVRVEYVDLGQEKMGLTMLGPNAASSKRKVL